MNNQILTSNYESVLVVSCKLDEAGIFAVIDKFKTLIEANATLKDVETWGQRKLAYQINKESDGFYVIFRFECGPDFPAELDRVYNITDGVLRSLIVKLDDEAKAEEKAAAGEEE